MKRRRFLPLAACMAAGPSLPAGAAPLKVEFRRPPPYYAYRERIPNGLDEFGMLPAAAEQTVLRPAQTRFCEVTGTVLSCEQLARGIPYWIARMDAATGIDIYGNNGVAVGDVDGDGVDEIYVCQPSGLPNRLFRWQQGRLVDISAESGVDLLDNTACALFVDLRNLGRQDLIVLRAAGPVLYLNDGRGRFTCVPDAFRYARAPKGVFTGMAAADYDCDGKLDVYCCTYSFFESEAQFSYPTPYYDAQNGPPNYLFRNRLNADGSGFFEDVTAAVGLDENNNRFSFAPAWCDYDASGWPSLYVANDFGRNNLYKNTNGRFRDVAAQAGVEDIGPGMSACWFDEEGDGLPDLYVSNMWTMEGQAVIASAAFRRRFPESLAEIWRRHAKGNSLYRNLGGGRFQEVSALRGVEMGRWAWSADAADFDNDGLPEIFVTCGMLTGDKQPDLAGFFWRQVVAQTPQGTKRSSAYEEGWNALNQFIREGYSWNGNERNVFYVRQGQRYRDASAESGLDFAGDSRAFAFTDIDGDGCLDLVVKNRLGPQLRIFQNCVGRQQARIALRLVGTASNRDAIGARVSVGVQVKWLSAGSGYLSQHTKTLHFGLPDPAALQQVEIRWPSGRRQRVEGLKPNWLYEIREGGGHRPIRRLQEPAVIRPQMAVADNAPKFADTWLVDPVPLPEKRGGPGLLILHDGGQKLSQVGAQVVDLSLDPTLAAAYSLFRRYLFEYRCDLELPLSLLLDHEGRAVKIYATLPQQELVARDLKRIDRRPALPYPGHALARPGRDYFKLGAALLWSGYSEQALPYLELVLERDPTNARTMALVAQIHREAGRLREAQRLADRALEIEPALPEAWNERGGIALAQGRPDDAIKNFEQALAIKSDLLYVLLNAAQAYAQLGRHERAEQFYLQAVAAHPQSAAAANAYGFFLARAGRYSEAEPWLRKATQLEASLATAWNNLGVLLVRTGREAQAIAVLEEGIRNNRTDETLYLNLGRIHVARGDRERARQLMRRLLELKPDSQVAAKALRDLESK